jgi:hypothetical protein
MESINNMIEFVVNNMMKPIVIIIIIVIVVIVVIVDYSAMFVILVTKKSCFPNSLFTTTLFIMISVLALAPLYR